MKYVISGGAGHTSRPIVLGLLNAGQQVTVIGRNPNNLKELVEKGAHPAIGSVEDLPFLQKTFEGAEAAYTMVPPNLGATDWKTFIGEVGRNYADAIASSSVKFLVNLSSVGAHMGDGAGPVTGLRQAEMALNRLSEVHILHLRPGYFFDNFYGTLGMIKAANIMGGNFGAAMNMVMSDTGDIAAVAEEALLHHRFSGHQVQYLASDERTLSETARILGTSIGKPGLPWVEFSDEESRNGMVQAGLPPEIARNFTEMGAALRSGKMAEDYWKHRPDSLGKTKLEDFAKSFAAAYYSS